MTENTKISMETIIKVYSAAIVLASQPLYTFSDVDICHKSTFVGDVVDRIQLMLNDFYFLRYSQVIGFVTNLIFFKNNY